MKNVTWKQLLTGKLISARRKQRRHHHRSAEALEQRVYLSAAAAVIGTELHIFSDADEAIQIRPDQDGNGTVEVLFNGTVNTGLQTLQANQVSALRVFGGAGDNLIDLSQVTSAEFSFIDPATQQGMEIVVEAGDGNDTILGSFDLNDSLFGGDGDDLINFAATTGPANPFNVGTAGLSPSSSGDTLNIINGTDTQLFESVGIVGNTTGGNSTGTLIAADYVLTSAQNVAGLGATEATFTLGTEAFTSTEITIHPGFDPLQIGTDGANDIAIVRLNREATGIAPSPLYRGIPQVGDLLTIVGFGAGGDGTNGEDGTFGTKRSGTTAVDAVTPTLLQWTFDDDTESNIAPGDTGGPDFVTINGELFIAGVSSGNTQANAAIGDVAFGTRVDVYANWIDFVLGTPGVSNRQGNLTIDGGDGNDTLNGADGNDTISGGDGHDTILAWIGDDVIDSGDGNDTIDGHDGADSIDGGDGQDSILAGDGDDTANGGTGLDTVLGEAGNDLLFGGGDSDLIVGDGGRTATPGNDTVLGNGGDDTLLGGGGSDELNGGNGDDILDPGDQFLTIQDATADPEGNPGAGGIASFIVTLSRPSALTVTVDVATQDGSAVAGLDYQASTTTLTFAPGVVTQTFDVQIIGDLTPENNETFSVVLSNPTNATVADSFATGTIIDDQDGPQQLVFLDFDTGTNFFDHIYTPAERTDIQARMEEDYGPFNVTFTQTRPIFGSFTTLLFNEPPTGGLADEIDFRNINLGLMATIDVNSLLGGAGEPAATSQNFVELSAKVAAHELGHLMGLRHGDAYGPIGSGITPTPGSAAYTPPFPGPAGASESNNHIMGSPAATGETLADAVSNQFFGARSAVKLSYFAFQGQLLGEQFGTHDTPANAQPITLAPLNVPNTEQTGSLAGVDFNVNATVVTGELSVADEIDVYAFDATAGQVVNIELMSAVLVSSPVPRFPVAFDTMVSVVDVTGTPIRYYTGTATNDNEFESTDSILIDLIMPSDGTFYIQVESAVGGEVGGYELFVYDFEATPATTVPEPPINIPQASVTLTGGAGNDTLNGTSNSDLIIGSGDDDLIEAGGGDDTVYAGGGRDIVRGGDGNDIIFGQGGRDTIEGGAGDDFVNGGGSNDFIYGDDIDGLTSGNDTLSGAAGADFLDGGAGDDLFYGGAGNDTMFGGAGNDTLFGQGGADTEEGGSGDDRFVWKQDGSDILTDAEGLEVIEVRGTNNVDTISVGQQGSTFTLTSGSSTLQFEYSDVQIANSFEGVVINARGGADQITINDVNNVGSMLLLVNGENGNDVISGAAALLGGVRLQIDGGNGDDTLTGTAEADTILGNAGDDSIAGGSGDDTLTGGDGLDMIDGDAGNDVIQGGLQNDTLNGGDGDDSMDGGDGSDIIRGFNGDDTLNGGAGRDVLDGKAGNDLLSGGEEPDQLLGGGGNDTLDGGRSNDTLRGHSGDDKIRGDHGHDSIVGGNGNDTIDGGDGDDTIFAGSGNDGVTGQDGNDILNTGSGNDSLLGGDGNDTLNAGGGVDIVLGQEGDDVLTGGGGADTIDGGEGVNTLVDAGTGDTVFPPGMPFVITSEIQANVDASN